MAKAYPQFVNYFDMAKETIVRCDEERPRFHAFLKVGASNLLSFRIKGIESIQILER